MQKLASVLALLIALLFASTCVQAKDTQTSADDDPVLQAMRAELERSKSALKLEGMAAPYYIDYHVTDMDTHAAEAAFGALRTNVRLRFRFLRVVVRVGDYKQDSFFGQGQGGLDFMPLDNDIVALRHEIWLATDSAYKAATEALTAKQAKLKQFAVDQPVDDFAHAEPVVSIGPMAKLDFDSQPWLKMLQDSSALYKTDPQIESFDSSLNFAAVTRYFVSSEGAVVRSGQNIYDLRIAGTTQASDGMRLDRSHGYAVTDIKELPSEEKLLADATKMLATLKELRDAPDRRRRISWPRAVFRRRRFDGLLRPGGRKRSRSQTRPGPACPHQRSVRHQLQIPRPPRFSLGGGRPHARLDEWAKPHGQVRRRRRRREGRVRLRHRERQARELFDGERADSRFPCVQRPRPRSHTAE